MPTHEAEHSAKRARRRDVVARARTALDALEHLVGGLGTAILELVALLWLIAVALTCLVGVGLLLAPTALRAMRAIADRERARLSRWGPEIIGSEPVPARFWAAIAYPTIRRELRWSVSHATLGLAIGLIGLVLPLNAVRDGTFPLWWRLVPPDAATPSLGFPTVHDQLGAFGVGLLGVGWIAMLLGLGPGTARLQAWPGRRLLAAPPDTDLSMRITQLTATRAAALDPTPRSCGASNGRCTTGPRTGSSPSPSYSVRPAARWPGTRPALRPSSNAPRTPPNRHWPSSVRSPGASCRKSWPIGGSPVRLPGSLRPVGFLPGRRRRPWPVRRLRRGDRLLRGG